MSAASAVRMAWLDLLPARTTLRSGPIAVLDLGSSKLCCFIARGRPDGTFVLRGRGYQAAEGFRTGEVIDAEAASRSIVAVLDEAEREAGEQLREVVLAVGCGEPRSTHLRVDRALHGRAVTEEDVEALLEQAARRTGAGDRTVLHVLPLEVSVDGGRPLKDPRGMRGARLDMLAHVVTVRARPLADLIDCVQRCHVDVRGVISTTYAAALATLTEEEANRGCLVIDMGGGATGVAFVFGGRLAFVDQVPYGGDNVTQDLAYGLHTSQAHAERLKSLFGGVLPRYGDDDERIMVPQVGDPERCPSLEVPRSRLTEIVRPRVEEILELVQDRLADAIELFRAMQPRSIVLTGGSSQIEGLDELAQEVFHLPVRCGRPSVVRSARGVESEPCCAAVSGALALARGDDGGARWRERQASAGLGQGLQRLGSWLRQNF